MSGIMPIHRLSALRPLSTNYAGGYWNSNPTAVIVLPRPDGTLAAAPIHIPRHAVDVEDVFPRDHVDGVPKRLFGYTATTVRAVVGEGSTVRIKLTECEDGLFAIFTRDVGESLYDSYNGVAQAENYMFPLPEAGEPDVYVRRAVDIVDEDPITEEVEYENPYGETVIEERVVGMDETEGQRWFAVRVSLYAATDHEATGEDILDDVCEQVRATAGDVPNIEYFDDSFACECEAGPDEQYARSGSRLIERLDKTERHQCKDCGGMFTTRNKRELADGMLGPY